MEENSGKKKDDDDEDTGVDGTMIVVDFAVQDVYWNHVRVQSVEVAWTDAQALALAKADLDVDATITADITLPTEITEYGATIVWASDNAAIGTDGTVTRPANGAGDAAVVLTASVTVAGVTEDVVFNVTVSEEEPPSMWDHEENFSTFVGSGSSYITETFTGDSGFSWDATQGRSSFSGYEIEGGGIMFRAKDTDTGSLIASAVTGGIGSLEIDILKGFTGAGTRTIEVYVNDVLVGSHTLAGTTVETLIINDINVEGTFKLEIRATGDDGKQIVVNNLGWTEYSAS